MKQRADFIVKASQVVTCAPGFQPRPGSGMNDVGLILDGAVAMQGELITAVGPAAQVLAEWEGDTLELQGTSVIPGLVDPHCHPLFAGSRVEEFKLRAQGATYQEIHAAGGGIASTVKATRAASEQALKHSTRIRLQRMMAHGTTTVEAKSGYGLTTAEEVRHLRILRSLGQTMPIDVVTTFMGAHALPEEYKGKREEFVQLILDEMIPAVAAEKLADFGDVFCEEGAFTAEESRRVLEACKAAGMGLRIHAEEFTYQGGARMAAELGARSADHLQHLPESDFAVLREAGTIPIMTPGTSFFLGNGKYAPARGLLAADLPLAVGTDFNAGSCLTESMQSAISLAVLRLKLTPEEALLAATVNAAHSLGVGHRVGSLEPGKLADLLVLDLPDWREWPYHFGVNFVRVVVKKGMAVNTILHSPLGPPL